MEGSATSPPDFNEMVQDCLAQWHALGESIRSSSQLSEQRKASANFHASVAVERTNDVGRIIGRLTNGFFALMEVVREQEQLRPPDGWPPGPLQGRAHDLWWQGNSLGIYLKMDFESLYLFGEILLDQWSLVVAYALQKSRARETSFHSLVAEFEEGEITSPLLCALWKRYNSDMIWLHANMRVYRNTFITHFDAPKQRGYGYDHGGTEFQLSVVQHVGQEFEDPQITVSKLLPYTPHWFQHLPQKHYLRNSPRNVLQMVLSTIDSVQDYQDRRTILGIVRKVGVITPSFHTVAERLLKFVDGSITAITSLVK